MLIIFDDYIKIGMDTLVLVFPLFTGQTNVILLLEVTVNYFLSVLPFNYFYIHLLKCIQEELESDDAVL